jgi:hypothetical protein
VRQAEVLENPHNSDLRWDWEWVIYWTVIFSLNLIVPLLLSTALTQDGGGVGVAFGIAALWMMGLAGCFLPRSFRKSMLVGGSIAALTQIFPILQLLCGSIAIASWQKLTGLSVEKPDSLIELSTFGITVLTGQFLIASSTIMVLILSAILRIRIPK